MWNVGSRAGKGGDVAQGAEGLGFRCLGLGLRIYGI